MHVCMKMYIASVCLPECIHVWMYTCRWVCVRVCVCLLLKGDLRLRENTDVYVCAHVCMYVCVCVWCVKIRQCVCAPYSRNLKHAQMLLDAYVYVSVKLLDS